MLHKPMKRYLFTTGQSRKIKRSVLNTSRRLPNAQKYSKQNAEMLLANTKPDELTENGKHHHRIGLYSSQKIPENRKCAISLRLPPRSVAQILANQGLIQTSAAILTTESRGTEILTKSSNLKKQTNLIVQTDSR
ncbi:hypothetical protein RF11_10325 [Thelohanellus kitauei]|uniref:Uncharacterized protein n=1 Tax=Thelohanellus kitauei TaxID=669202 RepID=A0A0C2M9Q1_THEKT|nr:hypothetical protein RF11_10325 [Thelohanellus kitauei]